MGLSTVPQLSVLSNYKYDSWHGISQRQCFAQPENRLSQFTSESKAPHGLARKTGIWLNLWHVKWNFFLKRSGKGGNLKNCWSFESRPLLPQGPHWRNIFPNRAKILTFLGFVPAIPTGKMFQNVTINAALCKLFSWIVSFITWSYYIRQHTAPCCRSSASDSISQPLFFSAACLALWYYDWEILLQ